MQLIGSKAIKIVGLVVLATVQLTQPRVARADSFCNTFCWTSCGSVQGAWCGAGCGVAFICAGGICDNVGLRTVNCFSDT